MTIYTATNIATLQTALTAAVGGDQIELAGGDYGEVWITQDFASDVTIVSADITNPAIFHQVHINGATHVIVDSIVFDYINDPADPVWVKPFEVVSSSFITIRHSIFKGSEVASSNGPGSFGFGYGLWVRWSSNVNILNNEFFAFLRAAVIANSSNIILRANDVHTVRSDGFNFWDVHGVLIEANYLHDFKRDVSSGDHPDMIQIWDVIDGEFSENFTIRGNFLDAGGGGWTQSIFINAIGDVTNFRNFLIEDNVIFNAHVHGISINGGMDGLQILNNTLLFNPWATDSNLGSGRPDINLFGSVLNATVTGNIAHREVQVFGSVSGEIGSNFLVQRTDPAISNYYGDVFVNALIEGPSLADLRAVTGGLIETLVVGADMTRMDIPLDVGPGSLSTPIPIPDPAPTPDPTPDPEVEPMITITDLIVDLIDASTETVVQPLFDGSFVDAAFLASGNATISITVLPSALTVGSMRLTVGGFTRVESVSPYALFGDLAGDFDGGLILAEGDHMLRIEVFSGAGASGTLMGDLMVGFTVGVETVPEEPPVEPPVEPEIDPLEDVLARIAVLEANVLETSVVLSAGFVRLAELEAVSEKNTSDLVTSAAQIAALDVTLTAVQPVLDSLQAQHDTLTSRLSLLENDHDELVVDIDSLLVAVYEAIDVATAAADTQFNGLAARVVVTEAKLTAGALGLGG